MPLDPPPEQLLADIVREGGKLVSLNPMRETLEDFFVEKVEQKAGAKDGRAAARSYTLQGAKIASVMP